MPLLFNFPKKRTAAEKKRRRRLTVKAVCLWGCGLAAFACLGLVKSLSDDMYASAGNEVMSSGTGRKLLQSEWNPMKTDVEDMGPLDEAGAPIWLFCLIWLFAGVAIVTDAFFTPALEGISTSMGLSEDVAGATFLAAASSAPEFFTSLADTFASDGGGMGVGTIVGSAVFNILVIVAVSCIPCDRLNLDWYPLARDSLFYVVAIIMLLVFVLTGESKKDPNITLKPTTVLVNVTTNTSLLTNDTNSSNWTMQAQTVMTGSGSLDDDTYGVIEWYESMMLLFGYVGYIIFMAFSGATKPDVVRCKDGCFKTNESGEYPEYDTHRDFGCQVVQQFDDEGEVLMLSTRAGDAMKPHTFSEPYAADSARVMPLEKMKSPQSARPQSARKQSAPAAVIPTPRRRREWEREKQKWEAQQSTPQPENAFTRWVISQRKQDDDESEGGMTPDGNTCAFDTFRDQPMQEPTTVVNETSSNPVPPNSPTSERTGRTMELQHRIAELTREKEEAKANDDLKRAAELKAEITALERKAFNIEDSSSDGSKGGDSDGEDDEEEWKESTITVVKKEFVIIRSCGELGFEVDEGDEDDKDAKDVLKVCRSRKRALEHGFKEEMEVVRLNGMKVASLEEFEEALQRCGNEDDMIFNLRISCEPPFWDPEWPEDEEDACCANCFWTTAWATVLPLLMMFKATIPRSDRRKTKNCYWAGFFMSIVWIGILSMYMLKFATWLGAICRIDPTVMGIVVLAAGTSVPDAMASYCAAKMGMADMAVSNALGSNVFNIFAGLGFPWFLSSVIKGEPILVPKKGIVLPTLILFLILFAFLWTLRSYNFQLTPTVGKIFMSMMLVYWTWTLLNEFVIGIEI